MGSKDTISEPSIQGRSFQAYAEKLLRDEVGIVPQRQGAPVRIALVYPNRYDVGMASLGFQTVYRFFNAHPEVRCERAFVYEAPFDGEIRTVESGMRLDVFDVVGFSLSFELDLLHVIRLLSKSRIPLFVADRGEKDPLVFVGGAVASLNPSPLLPFVDGLLVGEGEGLFYGIGEILFRLREGRDSRRQRLQAFSEIDGFFIPGLNRTVRRRFLPSLETCSVYTPIVTPQSHFENMFIVEVGRGCTRGCLFCAAQKIYQPYRFRSVGSIVETVARWNPGAHRIGLEGAGLSDYPNLEELCETLIGMGYEVSFSSIRADRVTPKLIQLLERGGVRRITVAPEAGSQRLRYRIGKGISNKVLYDVARLLGESSLETLKLYFLIGLPGETDADVQAIVDLIQELIVRFAMRRKKKRLRLSINAFVPKPFTEFQWAPMATERELSRKRKMIRQALKSAKGVVLVPKRAREEVLQGVLSQGDARIGYAMAEVVERREGWKTVLKRMGVDVRTLLHRGKDFEAELPWDIIDSGVSRARLWERYQKCIS